MRPQPATIGLPPGLCQLPLLLPTWSSLVLDPWRCRKCLYLSSASHPIIVKSFPQAHEPTVSSNPSSALIHCGMPTTYHWKLPTFSLHMLPSSVRNAVCKGAVTGMVQRWSFPRSPRTGVGSLSRYMALGPSHSLSELRTLILGKKRIGWTGSEGKPGLWTPTHTHRHTHTSEPLSDGHTLTAPRHTRRNTHRHTSQATWPPPPPASIQPSFPYINSPCPPVSPAITYLILGY